jgi:hypothetical protein
VSNSFLETSSEEELNEWFVEKYNEDLRPGHVFFALNVCYGRFSLSKEEIILYKNLRNFIKTSKIFSFFPFDIGTEDKYGDYERYDPYLIVTFKLLREQNDERCKICKYYFTKKLY